jgi:hypothetical protein
MYKAGGMAALPHIQALLGHKSIKTTEVYLKKLAPELVAPNPVPVIASARESATAA